MSLTKDERQWLRQAAENSAALRTLLQEHTNQLTSLFKITSKHGLKIEHLDTKQQMLEKQNDPGNKAERTSVWVAIGGVIAALVLGLINLFR